MEKISKWFSRKLLGAIVATLLIFFGIDMNPEMQAQLVAVIWTMYMAIQGWVDNTGAKTGAK